MQLTVIDTPVEKRELINSSGLLDFDWYLSQYKWVGQQGLACVEHYLQAGEKNNRLPNKYFYPGWYKRKYLFDAAENTSSLLHYIEEGRFLGYAPCPFFDALEYARRVGNNLQPEKALAHWIKFDRHSEPPVRKDLKLEYDIEQTGLFLPEWYRQQYMADDELSPIEHYSRFGLSAGYNPNPYFDGKWYLNQNPHVAASKIHPLLHYAQHGWRNGKNPSIRFNAQRYRDLNIHYRDRDNKQLDPLNHYLIARDRTNSEENSVALSKFSGLKFSPDSERLFAYRDFLTEPGFALLRYFSGAEVDRVQYRENFSRRLREILLNPEQHWIGKSDVVECIASVYHPLTNTGLFTLKVLDDFLGFIELLKSGTEIPKGIFDPEYYRVLVNKSLSDSECLKDWALSKEKGVPNQYFQPEIYRTSSGVEHEDGVELFRHWVYEGVFEDYCVGDVFDVDYVRQRLKVADNSPVFLAYLMSQGLSFNRKYGTMESGRENLFGHEMLADYFSHHSRASLKARLESGPLHRQIQAAAKYDPKIIQHGFNRPFSRPPFNSVLAPVVKKARQELPKKKYDSVVLIPHCRMSGATKIAGKFSEALTDLAKEESVLIVITDLEINKYPEWFSENADVFMLSSLLRGLEYSQKLSVVYDLLIGVRAKKVFNFNSALGWDVLEQYGARLMLKADLYTYYFCYDVNSDGVKVGYPSRYFVSTFGYFKQVFFDSDFLRCELIEKNMITDDADVSRMTTLYTPVEYSGQRYVYGKRASSTERKQIYWAGRLDRQKNFDLVCRIAELLPDFDFHCWGESVIGDYKIELHLPGNLVLHPPFRDIDDIDLQACDIWLYTALWDGIPNLLLEVGVRRIPLVSSYVWGIKDLLSSENSWIVADLNDETQYEQMILQAINCQYIQPSMSENLYNCIVNRHSYKNYMKSIRAVVYENKCV